MRKNVINGIGFLVAAAFVIVGSMGILGEISVWKLLVSFVLVLILIKSLLRLRWTPVLFSLAFLAILYDELLGIENLTPWPVLGAALLGSIGLNMILGKNHEPAHFNFDFDFGGRNRGVKMDGNGVSKVDESEHNFKCDVSFATITKYIKSQSLRNASINNSFGQVIIYFDEAVLENGTANVRVINSFGNVKLYIPSDWEVVVKQSESFGQVKTFKSDGIMNCVIEGSNKLYVSANTSFGDIEIHYI